MSTTYYICKYTPVELLEAFGGECAILNHMPDNFELSDQVAHPNICGFGKSLLEACMASDHPVLFPYPLACTGDADIQEFKAILEKHKGTSTVQIQFELNNRTCIMELGPRWRVQASPQLNKDMDAWAKARLALRQ